MYENGDFIKKFKEQWKREILIGFPESFILKLLVRMSNSGLNQARESPGEFLERKMDEAEFSATFMKIFEKHARQEFMKDFWRDDMKALRSKLLAGSLGLEPEGVPLPGENVLEKELDTAESAEEFMSRFDDYAASGKAHIFVYKVVDKKYLKKLKEEPDAVLQKNGRKMFEQNIPLWGSAQPVLTAIERRSRPGRNELWFKWVESRLWDERTKGVTDDSPPHFLRRLDRTVNYFIVDLNSGISQLRIQLIRPNALKSLKFEYELYTREIEKYLDFSFFRRIALESVVKNFLLKKEIVPKSWEIQLPGGVKFTANGKPALFINFFGRIPFLKTLKINIIKRLDFFGRKLTCECQLKKRDWGSLDVRIKVDGEKDILTVLSQSDLLQMDTIIEKVLHVKRNRIVDGILKRLSINKQALKRIFISFDYHFTRLEEKKIKASQIETGEWLKNVKIQQVMDLLIANFPGKYISIGSGRNRVLEKV